LSNPAQAKEQVRKGLPFNADASPIIASVTDKDIAAGVVNAEGLAADGITLRPEQYAALKNKADGWDLVAPELDRIQQLAADGWLPIGQGDTLIGALTKQVTLLRAERLPPPINHHFEAAIAAAFDVMTEALRTSLHRTEHTVQQLRYQAFRKGVETLVTLLVSNGRQQAYNTVLSIITSDIADAERVIGLLRAPVTDAQLSSDQRKAAEMHMQRSRNAERLDGQLVFMRRISEVVGQIIAGGITPEQAQERIKALREGLGLVPGVALN
jgi:hypothetical protein